MICPMFVTSLKPDNYTVTENCGNCANFVDNRCSEERRLIMWSSEAHKKGLVPTEDMDIDEFRNSLDPDAMGFDGTEGGEEDEDED